MLRLKPRQRAVLVEKVRDVANIGVGVLVFGPFVGAEPASVGSVIAGLVLWVVLVGAILLIAGEQS